MQTPDVAEASKLYGQAKSASGASQPQLIIPTSSWRFLTSRLSQLLNNCLCGMTVIEGMETSSKRGREGIA